MLLKNEPVRPDELDDEDIKETAFLRITEKGGGTSLVQYRDVVKSIKNGRTFAVLGVENQSEIDYSMPFRVLEIDFVNYVTLIEIHPGATLGRGILIDHGSGVVIGETAVAGR